LPLLRGLVLRVFAQVAVLPRTLNLLRQVDLPLAFERGDFIGESLENTVFHGENDFNIMVREANHRPAECARARVPGSRARTGPCGSAAPARRRASDP